MGQYKVPQDVEAEDKIIGPLTLKQFIYAVIGVAWGGISFTLFKAVPVVFILVGLPPAILFIMLGLYRRQDQPFEVYLAAVFTYFGQSRKRLWEKEPIEEVFKVEAPLIKAEAALRDPREVIGQLDRLARIVDTRGYSTKQPELQEPTSSALMMPEERLTTPVEVSASNNFVDVAMSDDILDFQNNLGAQNINNLIESSASAIRQDAVTKMQAYSSTSPTATTSSPALTPPNSATFSSPASPPNNLPPSTSDMTQNPLTAILKLAMEPNDLTVSQLAAQAARQQPLAEGQSINLRDQPK